MACGGVLVYAHAHSYASLNKTNIYEQIMLISYAFEYKKERNIFMLVPKGYWNING